MSRIPFLLLVAWTWIGAGVLMRAETPVEKAWGILETGVKEKSFNQRSHAVLALGLIPDKIGRASCRERV